MRADATGRRGDVSGSLPLESASNRINTLMEVRAVLQRGQEEAQAQPVELNRDLWLFST